MVYKPNIPLPTDNLSVSQGDLVGNFQSLNTTFGIDHYPFADTSANSGKHNVVTTPLINGAAHPNTSATEDKFYAMKDTVPLGILQYSRGWDTGTSLSSVPTPVTSLQSPSNPLSVTNGLSTPILDFTGITRVCFFEVYAFDVNTKAFNTTTGFWNGTSFTNLSGGGFLPFIAAGSVLTVRNNTASPISGLYWVLRLLRIQV